MFAWNAVTDYVIAAGAYGCRKASISELTRSAVVSRCVLPNEPIDLRGSHTGTQL